MFLSGLAFKLCHVEPELFCLILRFSPLMRQDASSHTKPIFSEFEICPPAIGSSEGCCGLRRLSSWPPALSAQAQCCRCLPDPRLNAGEGSCRSPGSPAGVLQETCRSCSSRTSQLFPLLCALQTPVVLTSRTAGVSTSFGGRAPAGFPIPGPRPGNLLRAVSLGRAALTSLASCLAEVAAPHCPASSALSAVASRWRVHLVPVTSS